MDVSLARSATYAPEPRSAPGSRTSPAGAATIGVSATFAGGNDERLPCCCHPGHSHVRRELSRQWRHPSLPGAMSGATVAHGRVSVCGCAGGTALQKVRVSSCLPRAYGPHPCWNRCHRHGAHERLGRQRRGSRRWDIAAAAAAHHQRRCRRLRRGWESVVSAEGAGGGNRTGPGKEVSRGGRSAERAPEPASAPDRVSHRPVPQRAVPLLSPLLQRTTRIFRSVVTRGACYPDARPRDGGAQTLHHPCLARAAAAASGGGGGGNGRKSA